MADEKAVATVDVDERRKKVAAELANTGREFTPAQIATIKNTLGKDLTDDELRFFVGVCSRTGLDPFLKQVYPIKYGDKMAIQVGIDGYRALASSSGLYDGQDPPQWCGPDGQWRDVWLEDGPPYAARVAVYRKDVSRPIVAVCRYSAYVVTGRDGKPSQMWDRMDAEQLAKCTESLALRKAFPKDLAGITTTEEALVDVPRDERASALPGVRAAAERSVAEVMNGHDEEEGEPVDSISEHLTSGPSLDEFLTTCKAIEKALGRKVLKNPDGNVWFSDMVLVKEALGEARGVIVMKGDEYVLDAADGRKLYDRMQHWLADSRASA